MTKLPERRDPGDRIVLKPREDLPDSVPTKLPEQHDPRVRELAPPPPQADRREGALTKLPEHRHSDDEVQNIRRRGAFQVRPPLAHIRSQIAPWPVVVAGYLLAVAGGITWLTNKETWVHARLVSGLEVAGGVGAVVVALLIALNKPRSRHHAAFIAILGLLVIVFGVLQLLPHPDAT